MSVDLVNPTGSKKGPKNKALFASRRVLRDQNGAFPPFSFQGFRLGGGGGDAWHPPSMFDWRVRIGGEVFVSVCVLLTRETALCIQVAWTGFSYLFWVIPPMFILNTLPVRSQEAKKDKKAILFKTILGHFLDFIMFAHIMVPS